MLEHLNLEKVERLKGWMGWKRHPNDTDFKLSSISFGD